jgi:hypothetical protein
MQGHVRIRRMDGREDREELAGIHGGDAAVWKYLDFGTGARHISLRVRSKLGGTVIVRADGPDGPELGRVRIPAGKDWAVRKARIKRLAGIHALWLDFDGVRAPEVEIPAPAGPGGRPMMPGAVQAPDEYELFALDWIRFR